MTTSKTSLVRRRTGAALVGAALVGGLIAVTPAAGALAGVFRGDLRDLQTATTEPFEGATAQVVMTSHTGGGSGSTVLLTIKDIGASAAGHTYGAHLHVGPCVSGSGGAALGHYNHSTTGEISPSTEVWLDFTPNRAGNAQSVAHVPFVPEPGQRSVVIHRDATHPVTGLAGPRLACLPVEW